MDTIQARDLRIDGSSRTVRRSVQAGIFHREMPTYEISKYRNKKDEHGFRVCTDGSIPIPSKIKNNSFL